MNAKGLDFIEFFEIVAADVNFQLCETGYYAKLAQK